MEDWCRGNSRSQISKKLLLNRICSDSQRKQEGVMEGAVQLLANIIALLTPLPYFRPILMTVADKVLDAGEMFSNSVSPLP
jgi:hypothetical protein